ncbi:MAG: glycoside hydrolase family 127 protein [Victivallaceae bacterium]
MITLKDRWLAPRQETNRSSTIPSSLERCRETGRIEAFRLQWRPGEPNRPHIFWDSDVAKVLEGMALSLELFPDPAMAAELEELITLVLSAQQPDGYLNSYFTQVEPDKRWSNLFDHHELYCAGHLIEAAVAHYRATGKTNFLDGMRRYADYIATVFGRGANRRRGCPGHEELELALVKLADATGEKKYLDLARYFIDERGTPPSCFLGERPQVTVEELRNRQAHRPVREQCEADGHAVRALYLYCGMADVAARTGDRELLAACERLFDNVTERRMYVTGGVGSTAIGEAFTADYHLPNDSAYAESCAAIALLLFADRMLKLTGEAKYREVVERVLFNSLLAGISLSGDRFFYANLPEVAANTFTFGHISKERQPWFGCSCCPTNYCRIMPQLGEFCYRRTARTLCIDVPVAMVINEHDFELEIDSAYPVGGKVTVEVRRAKDLKLDIGGRSYMVNGGDRLDLELELPVRLLYSHPKVTANAGRAALARGPLIYVLESVDNPDIELATAVLAGEFSAAADAIGGVPFVRLESPGRAVPRTAAGGALYREAQPEYVDCRLSFIPFALWQNRGPSELETWVGARPGKLRTI